MASQKVYSLVSLAIDVTITWPFDEQVGAQLETLNKSAFAHTDTYSQTYRTT
jgi:hypothetical protein